jgi:deoxyadenosine/deoxycytidine kinase
MFISIEGNIGSGKSTLLAHLKARGGELGGRRVVFVPEPVHLWEEIRSAAGANMIELFYADQPKYSFAFQVMAFVSRYKLLEAAVLENPNAIIIAERGLDADRIFATMLYSSGKMLREEYVIYMQLFDCFNRMPARGVIYLRCTPETAKARCIKRNRPGEIIPLDYLQQCHEHHEAWISVTHALILDADNDMDAMEGHVHQIEAFLEKL